MASEDALTLLAIHCKADPTFHPVKQATTLRWHALTTGGEFEILTTGVKWLDTRVNKGGGGAIDLAMHVLDLPFVDAVKLWVFADSCG
jgi:hypothetical protein